MRMIRVLSVMLAGTVILEASAAVSLAHEMPWRAGVSRQLGYGHCAKGPCTKRTCWASTRPHRHVNGKIVTDRFGSSECWRGRLTDSDD